MDTYLKKMLPKEVELKRKEYDVDFPPETAYIGGGSPNYITENQMRYLLKYLDDEFRISESKETTFEMNPSHTTHEQLDILTKYNVSRVSFGVQTIVPGLMQTLGRINDIKKIEENIQYAKQIGLTINVDFMVNLPKQTMPDIQKDIDFIIRNLPDSAYWYECKYVTPTMKNRDNDVVGHSEFLRRLAIISNKLGEHGYSHNLTEFFSRNYFTAQYNINWISKHNLFGLGPFSISRFGNTWYKSQPNLKQYSDSLLSGRLPIWFEHHMENLESALLDFAYQIRFGKVIFSDFADKYGINIREHLQKELEELSKGEYIVLDSEKATLTKKGLYETPYVQEVLSRKIEGFISKLQLMLGRPENGPNL